MSHSKHAGPAVAEHDAHAAHEPHLAHHFDSLEQQQESATLGMWLFLATEILLFGGLFCAYAVYRANHPEVFEWAHVFLNRTWGATNTVILLLSSFTMAAGVWAAEHSRPRMLVTMLALTILCACGFLGIKFIEYKNKWEEGLLWGPKYHPTAEALEQAEAHEHKGDHPHDQTTGHSTLDERKLAGGATSKPAASAPAAAPTPAEAAKPPAGGDAGWVVKPAESGPRGLLKPGKAPPALTSETRVRNAQLFFSIYFGMTGLHGLHVIAGMLAIGWILKRALRREFSSQYYTPVHMVGLYWHVVDLVWIYLFPLLYLIH